MSIHYRISSELGIAFMFCEGVVSDVEYFNAVKTMYNEETYQIGMRRIVDLFSATESVSVEGMRAVIQYRETMAEKGIKFEHVILLTYSTTIYLFVKTMKLLSTKANMKFEAASSLDEAISILGFQEKQQAITDFYTQSKHKLKIAS